MAIDQFRVGSWNGSREERKKARAYYSAYYSVKKHDRFVVRHQRNPAELRRKLKRQIRPWSDLPSDLLSSEVMPRFSSADQIRFRSVCKSWGILPPPPPPPPPFPIHVHDDEKQLLPWVLTYDPYDQDEAGYIIGGVGRMYFKSRLFDPTHPEPYSVDEVIGEDMRSAMVLASKHGWLLFSQHKPSFRSYFLFSPFTKQIITLPDLDHTSGGVDKGLICRAHLPTFSSDPNSPDCIFFILLDFFCGITTISTCHLGDTTWTTRAFEDLPDEGLLEDVVFAGGNFYCLWYCGALAAYSVARQDWTVLNRDPVFRCLGSCHLVECNGRLLLAYVVTKTLKDLFRFSEPQMVWVPVTSLGDHTLFLGRTSFSVPASGPTRNKVFFHVCSPISKTDWTPRFHSLDDGKSHSLEGSPYKGWLAAKGRVRSGIWMDPPQFSIKRILHNSRVEREQPQIPKISN